MSTLPDYDWPKEEAQILKAVWDGAGDKAVQRRALVHLVEILCGVNQVGFDPDNTHMTAFNAGRKWVARQLQNAITLPIDQLVKDKSNDGPSSTAARRPGVTGPRARRDQPAG